VSVFALTLGSYRAEWLKLSRRPATWILGIILGVAVLALGYAFIVVAVQLVERTADTARGPGQGAIAQFLRDGMLPRNLVAQVLPLVNTIGGPIALILGALTIGSEYSWGTLKTILTQRAGRLSVLGGKLLGLVPILLIFCLGAMLVGLLGSLLYAAIAGASFALPSARDVLSGLGAAWLILATWTMLGVAMAALFRSAALAIGLGLVYALALETIVSTVAIFVEQIDSFRRILLGANTGGLANSFAASSPGAITSNPIPPERATLILVAYIAAFLLITAIVIRRRDVA